jgi:peptidyl-prolyl cis-trans isomerase C
MFTMIRISLLTLIAVGLAIPGHGQEQTTPKSAAIPGAGAPGGASPAIPGANDVLATATSHNQTAKVTKAEVLGLLSRFPLPAADEREIVYNRAIELLVNAHLLNQYLVAQHVQVPEAQIDEQVQRMQEQLKKQGQDLPTLLLQNGSSMADVRKEIGDKLRLSEFVKNRATDAELRKFMNTNRDRFSGTQVRASHILLKVEPNASDAEKQKVKEKLQAIRNEIVQNKISFAAAANKYSEDPANAGGAGGDLDYFTLNSDFVEEFAHAAFKLKKGEISEPVETPFGIHLIQVTDRKEGRLPDFEKNKPYIGQEYSMELQKEIVTEERKTAKIDVKPMPKDLFPSEPAAAAPATPAAAPAPAAGGAAAPKP